MGEVYTVEGEGIRISSPLPVIYLEEMEIEHRGNEHGKLRLQAVVGKEAEEKILQRYWLGERILVEKEDGEPLFHGRIEGLRCRKENRMLSVEVTGTGGSVCLDRVKKTVFFQNLALTYGEVIRSILRNYENAAFLWGAHEDRCVEGPFVQYEETDWDFLVRLCSHFHGRVFPDLRTGMPNFYFGLPKGTERSADAAEILETGFDGAYYTNGCREEGFPGSYMFYLSVRSKENWQMGDFLMYEGRYYRIYERKIRFAGGELLFFYKLGTEGMYREKKKCNESLIGARFTGIVRKTDGESVYLQLNMDREEAADYPWEWAPETNNLCYCMPEEGTGAALVFPSAEEASGYVALAEIGSPEGDGDRNSQNREFATKWDKRIGLYPARMFLEGAGGCTEIAMEDEDGIRLESQGNITVSAEGNVYLEGKSVSVAAPLEAVCKTPQSNIELCRNINLYAPSGVQTVGTGKTAKKKQKEEAEQKKEVTQKETAEQKAEGGQKEEGKQKNTEQKNTVWKNVKPKNTEPKDVEHWQASYTALAAIPAVDLQAGGGMEKAVDIFAMGSIAKIAKGSVTIAMSEVMEGKKESECSFPKAFRSMDNYMVNGGYALPKEREDE